MNKRAKLAVAGFLATAGLLGATASPAAAERICIGGDKPEGGMWGYCVETGNLLEIVEIEGYGTTRTTIENATTTPFTVVIPPIPPAPAP